jgi:PPM family protein phosphatase
VQVRSASDHWEPGETLKIEITAKSDIGRNRKYNEDRAWISAENHMVAVLDGCGAFGKAAEVVVAELRKDFDRRLDDLDEKQVMSWFRAADAGLAATMRGEATWAGGTTLDLLVITGGCLLALHIGDGRIFRIRDGAIQQLSTDHTLVAEMIGRGELSEDEAKTNPHRNVMTRAMTGASDTEPEIFASDIRGGDVFIACTDGVWGTVDSASLLAHIGDGVDAILALSQASNDNASIAVVRIS